MLLVVVQNKKKWLRVKQAKQELFFSFTLQDHS